jgi:predicted NBD/HSP70 family sugar kinase
MKGAHGDRRSKPAASLDVADRRSDLAYGKVGTSPRALVWCLEKACGRSTMPDGRRPASDLTKRVASGKLARYCPRRRLDMTAGSTDEATMKILSLDIGGSSIKACAYSGPSMNGTVERKKPPDYTAFGPWIEQNYGSEFDTIAVGIPGSVDLSNNRVKFAYHPNWIDFDLASAIRTATGVCNVLLANDAEAHAYSMQGVCFPLLQLTLGSGFGIAVLDAQRRFVRTQDASLDVGHFDVSSSLSNSHVWHALSSKGLKELEEKNSATAIEEFAKLVGDFATSLIAMFQPKTAGFSGGIIKSHPTLTTLIRQRCEQGLPDWYLRHIGIPAFVSSPDPENSGVTGLAVMALDQFGK